jgi:uncharacterized membrane protein
LGALALVIGIIFSLINLGLAIMNLTMKQSFTMLGTSEYECLQKATFQRARLQLGVFTAVSLTVLVAADVLETLIHGAHELTYDVIGKMAAIAAFRTVLAYFLGKEIKEIEEEIEHEDHKLHGLGHGHGDAHGDGHKAIENHGHGHKAIDDHAHSKDDHHDKAGAHDEHPKED